MSGTLEFFTNRANAVQIAEHLRACDSAFVPPLGGRVKIGDYTHKIAYRAIRFEAWSNSGLVGLVAAYCNDNEGCVAFITSVSVLPRWQNRGIATQLIENCIDHVSAIGFTRIELELNPRNVAATNLYQKHGFSIYKLNGQSGIMFLPVGKEAQMNRLRDYNIESKDTIDRQYAYNFDFDVMHPYMIQSFEPLFNQGNMLELGSFKGDFTRRLTDYFDDITCVEASYVAIKEAKRVLGEEVKFIYSHFETVTLPQRYDNIVLTHVLEHLDDPVQVLKRINDEWLAEDGRLFLVCPNANAPSRQIAVKMGLIPHNAAVTPSEAEHGHRSTYSLDTLERDAVEAGLKVVHRSGIFFKALANYQWDRLLQTDIISKEYLDGCYKIGQQYPDLCSSIFLVCEHGGS